MKPTILAIGLFISSFSMEGQAAIIYFDDANEFFAAVGETKQANWSEIFTTTDHAASWVTVDETRLAYGENNNDFTNPFRRDDFTPFLPGNEISVRGRDNIHILLGKVITQPNLEIFAPDETLFAFGLRLAEPTSSTGPDSGAVFRDSMSSIRTSTCSILWCSILPTMSKRSSVSGRTLRYAKSISPN